MVFSRILKTPVTILMVGTIVSSLLFEEPLVADEFGGSSVEPGVDDSEGTIRGLLNVYDLNDDEIKKRLEMMLGHVGQGIDAANGKVFWRHDVPLSPLSPLSRLYCLPEKLDITYNQYFSIFRRATEENPWFLNLRMGSKGMVLLEGLIETFPCNYE